jgi:hypothetical protein
LAAGFGQEIGLQKRGRKVIIMGGEVRINAGVGEGSNILRSP